MADGAALDDDLRGASPAIDPSALDAFVEVARERS
jgi:hypothetical protein